VALVDPFGNLSEAVSMSDPPLHPRAVPSRVIHGTPEVPILLPRRASVEAVPAFSESDAEAILVRLRGAVAAGASELGPILTALVETAHMLTGAGGVALALRCDGMVTCRARSGEPSPEVGVYLDQDSGISGQCLRTGEILRCEDALTDFRVNPVVCRTLGLRSIAIVPIRRGAETCGILEAFSTRPYAFSEMHINFLSRLAELAEAAEAQDQSRMELSKQAKMAPAAVAVEAEPPVLPSLAPAPTEPTPNYDAMVARLRDQLYEGRSLGKLYEPAKRRLPLLATAAAAVALVVGVGWSMLGGPTNSQAHNPTHRPAAAEQQMTPAEAPVSAEETATARPSPGRPMEKTSRRSEALRPQRADKATAPDVVTRDVVTHAESLSSQAATAEDSSVGADAQPVEPVRTEQVRIEQARIESEKTEPAKIEPAKIETTAVDGAALGNLLVAHATLPKLGVPVSGGVSVGVPEHRVQPVYPRFALERKLEGAVVLEATIADSGRVQSVRVISGQAVLALAAVEAVKQWRYRPTLLDGKPVSAQTQITITFKAPK
jgi:TonB family protein